MIGTERGGLSEEKHTFLSKSNASGARSCVALSGCMTNDMVKKLYDQRDSSL